jgi:PST family polysaccharide transporter
VLVFLLRAPLARWVVGDVDYAYGVGWLGIGVAASVIGAVFTAMLQGLLRIGDFAKVVIIGNIVGTTAAIAVVWRYGVEHIYFAVICLPVSIALVGAFFVRGLVSFGGAQAPRHLAREFSALIRFGGVMLFVTMLSMSVVMAARALIAQRLGLEAAGQFHAAWLLSSTYIGFLLTSMTADYYPRLTATIANGGDAAGLINEQIHLGVALISPVIVAVIGFAPLIILVLYSAKFAPAAEVLQVQVLGDLFRILSFPFAFALLSANATGRFLIAEISWSACYFLCLHFGIDHFGLTALGYVYLASCFLYAVLVVLFAHRTFDLNILPHVRRVVAVSAALSLVTLAAAKWSVLLGYGAGGLTAFFLGFSALRLVLRISQIEKNGFAVRLARLLPGGMKAFLQRWIGA